MSGYFSFKLFYVWIHGLSIFKAASQAGTPVSDSDTSQMLDVSTFDIRGSPSLSRHRMGSFNSNYDNTESPGEF